MWDGNLRRQLGVLADSIVNVSEERVTALAFCHDGATLAVAGSQGSLQLWDVPSQLPLGSPLPTAGDELLPVTFNGDDTAIYTAGKHVLWQKHVIDPDHMVATICQRAGTPLPRADWNSYLPEVPYRRTC